MRGALNRVYVDLDDVICDTAAGLQGMPAATGLLRCRSWDDVARLCADRRTGGGEEG